MTSAKDKSWRIPPKHSLQSTESISVGRVNLIPPKEFPQLFQSIGESLTGSHFSDGPVVDVVLHLYQPNINKRPVIGQKLLQRPNSFWIRFLEDQIEVYAPDPQGLIYAVDELARVLSESGGSPRYAEIIDAPDHGIRGLHIVMRKLDSEDLKRVIENARSMRLNVLVLELGDMVRFRSPAVSPSAEALSIAEFINIVEYARASGMDVVPEVKLLTKQQKFFKNLHPELMFNRYTYDPSNPEVYKLVFEYLDEVIELVKPKAIHIGHDELAGIRTKQGLKERMSVDRILPPELFLYDVQHVTKYLHAKNVETWMWGDMLLDPADFPSMDPRNLHGIAGYAKLRNQIAREIVVTDWHYWDTGEFPSARAFETEGHPVIGATWKKAENTVAFSRYVARLPSSNARGMLATTWSPLQKRHWELVETIIGNAGLNFWLAPEN